MVPGLHLLPLGISNAYLWHDDGGTTLIDTGPPGSGSAIRSAMQDLGLPRAELRRVVLTHFHDDHAGSAADLVKWSGATVVAGAADAAFVRGDAVGPSPVFTPAEQQLHAVVAADLQPASPVGSTRRSPTRTSSRSAAGQSLSRFRATLLAASLYTCPRLGCC